ncbi:DNA-packaging protein [Kordiimonas sp. SCSIO 12610]|uniref:DNA-packaging protein n=1 Tax=Kordiimonas sp. SCSIO 12610 TaxID=2829597 RepID=UPI00210D22F5|nr:terminase family protein [Kordiimonas sp. SCSIO 12610]UTW56171.1 DNA-packaging protein [Kordiimonas sp. SCSIO 12610]
MPQAQKQNFLNNLSPLETLALHYDWDFWARENQQEPKGDWTHWLILAGRGFGKTRTGAEWVRMLVETSAAKRIALIAPTIGDARRTMVEGESGLIAVSPPWNRPKFEPSKSQLIWPSGAIATLYSASEPERLRGPQHDAAWCDELCAWANARAAFDNLMFGLRLGARPRTCITTTPRPIALLKDLMAAKNTHVTKGTTYDNLDNLAPTFADDIIKKYEGTRIGRQELNADLLEDVPGALWTRRQLDACRITEGADELPDFTRIVVAVDPPVSVGEKADECGIVAVGLGGDGCAYVLRDASIQGETPLGWAERAVNLYQAVSADCVVAEVNQGGALVETIMRQIDPLIPIKSVHARRGKYLRAEPVAALYEQGRVFHVGSFMKLEDQMCSFTNNGHSGNIITKRSVENRNLKSPDRLDALVWAITDLMLAPRQHLRMRKL